LSMKNAQSFDIEKARFPVELVRAATVMGTKRARLAMTAHTLIQATLRMSMGDKGTLFILDS
jgi:hypothetical protein